LTELAKSLLIKISKNP